MVNKYSKKNVDTYNWLRAIPHFFTIYFILYPFYKLWFRIKVEGRENIPTGENLLIAANHLSYFDPTIISLSVLNPVAYIAKKELFNVPVLKQFILMYGAIAVDREKLEISTIRSAKNILQKKGWYVSIFPEGTRSTHGTIIRIHKGMGFLAKSTKCRVLPLGIINSEKKRGPIRVKIGKPISVDQSPDEIANEWLKQITALTGFKSIDLEEEAQASENSSQEDKTLQEV